jgi:hypothetical protein
MAARPWHTSTLHAASAVPQTMRTLLGLDLPMTAQALLGQTYSSPLDLWAGLDERRKVLNHHLPSRALSHQPPIARLSRGHALGRILPRLHGKRSSSLWRRGARTSPRAAGSAAFARMGSLVEVALTTTSGSTWREHRVALHFDPEALALICLPEGCLRDYSAACSGTHESRVDG